jgi:hypothetical protein
MHSNSNSETSGLRLGTQRRRESFATISKIYPFFRPPHEVGHPGLISCVYAASLGYSGLIPKICITK